MNTDAPGLPELTERQENILALIVREYTNNPTPVGSKTLVERYFSSLSSATVRNDMSRLEELGLLSAPHTSAGRVPTEAGYRYFVKRLLSAHERELPADEKRTIAAQFNNVAHDMESWLRLSVAVLARVSSGAALVTPPRALSSQFKHLALIATHGRMVMMVLVLQGGDVRQQMLMLAEGLSQEVLSTIATHLNALCEGLSGEQVRNRARTLDSELEREILEVCADTLDEVDHSLSMYVYREGLSSILPQFPEREGAQQAVQIIEDRGLLENILAESPEQDIGQVRVIIGGEGRWHDTSHLGMVLSRYGVRGQVVGSLVVLGPTRMRYGRAISAISYVAGLVSNLMFSVYGEGDKEKD